MISALGGELRELWPDEPDEGEWSGNYVLGGRDVAAVAVARDIRTPGRLGSWHQRYALVARDDVLVLSGLFPRVMHTVLGALCAVNRVLIEHPSFKWSALLVDRLRIRPVELRSRLWRVANGPVADAVPILDDLLAETLAIVDRELPELSPDELRRELIDTRNPVGGLRKETD